MLNLPVGSAAECAYLWALKVGRLIRRNPELSAQVPEGTSLCVLPEDAPELARYNLGQTEQQAGAVVLVVVTGGAETPEIILWADA